MRIVDLLNKDSILLNGAPKSKTEAIDMLVDLQMKSGNISDREIYKQGILAREEKGSTAVGEGIAIPHAKSSAVKAPSLAAMTVPGGVEQWPIPHRWAYTERAGPAQRKGNMQWTIGGCVSRSVRFAAVCGSRALPQQTTGPFPPNSGMGCIW